MLHGKLFSYIREQHDSVDQLGRSMRLGNLGEQIVLKSERAFKSIRFAGFQRAPQALYGPLAKERDEAARDLVWQPIALEYDLKPCSSKKINTKNIAV